MCKCNTPIEIKFAVANDTVKIPTKKHNNAGYDIYANFEESYIMIQPHKTKMIPTNLASVIPSTHYFQLFERGSTGTKGIGQRCGVIDASFRGLWFVPLTNTTNKTIVIAKNVSEFKDSELTVYPYSKAISQAVLLPVPNTKIDVITMDELLTHKTDRGIGALGSSGK